VSFFIDKTECCLYDVILNMYVVFPTICNLIRFVSLLLLSNNDLNETLDEMVAKFKEWYPDMLSASS